jgi:hypothetical protein
MANHIRIVIRKFVDHVHARVFEIFSTESAEVMFTKIYTKDQFLTLNGVLKIMQKYSEFETLYVSKNVNRPFFMSCKSAAPSRHALCRLNKLLPPLLFKFFESPGINRHS